MPLAPGTRLGPYEIVAPVGAGGMGEVYKAIDTRLDRTVAIKILPSTDPARRQRFAREGKAIGALSHPNICTLHDVGHDAGTDFLVTEYLEGETLSDRLARGPLPIDALLDVAGQICDGLAAAHAANITHRDLKPLNIFITRTGQAKVLDFGLARFECGRTGAAAVASPSVAQTFGGDAQLTTAGIALGTMGYMSPEQARGDPTDFRSDVFSLGAVLYEMATGRPAFEGKTAAVVFDQLLNKTPAAARALNVSVPAELERIIARALEKDPDHRYQTVAALQHELAQVRGRQARRRPLVTRRAVIAGTAALAASVVALFAVASRRSTGSSAASGAPIESVAVLPFVNASGTSEADYLAEGITGTLTSNLAQLRGLRVVPRTVAAKYRNRTADPALAGRELNARAVVTGRIVQHGDRLTIETELVDAATVAQLWGDQFDRPLADMLRVQSDISKAIADNLRVRLSGEERNTLTAAATSDVVAYQLYLRGQYTASRRTKEGYRQATQYFTQAIARDPSYALAYAGVADAAIWQAYWGYEPAADAYERALVAATKAVAIDDRTADAHALLGWIHLYRDWNWPASDREYQRALSLDPDNATIRGFYAEALATRGRFDEAIAEAKRAAALDPLSARIAVTVGFILTNARRYDEAIDALKRAVSLDPDQTLSRLDLARAYRLAGRLDLAVAESQRMLDSGDPLGPAFLAASYARAGREREARRILASMTAEAERSGRGQFLLSLVCVSIGDRDEAFRWLDGAFVAHDTFLPWLNVDPDFDKLRADPRFDALVQRIGIPGS